MDKQFMCFWDGKYYEEEKTEMKPVDFFSENNGYFPENIKEIEKLKVGETFTPEKGQIVTRVK